MDRRPWLVALSTAALVAACSGQLTPAGGVDGGAPDANPLVEAARQSFEDGVLPMMTGFCASCHSTPGVVGFMVPAPDVYTSVTGWPLLVDVDSPRDSRLLTKGVHDGPAWTAEQSQVVRDWIDLESQAAGHPVEEEPETAAFSPIVGINTVDLAPLGLAGSTLTFRAEKLTVGLYLSEIMIHAGVGGVHVTHPLFVRWVAGAPSPDPVDSFADIDLSVAATTTAMVGGGTLVLVELPPDAQLSVHFRTAEPQTGGGGPGDPGGPGGGLGGCANVAAFTANAQPRLAASCASCHAGTDSQATNATDMTSINDLSAAGQALACGQILSRVNLGDPINSGIFIAPDPGSGSLHPFKFGGDVAAFQDFRGDLLVWIAQE